MLTKTETAEGTKRPRFFTLNIQLHMKHFVLYTWMMNHSVFYCQNVRLLFLFATAPGDTLYYYYKEHIILENLTVVRLTAEKPGPRELKSTATTTTTTTFTIITITKILC